MVHPGSEDYRSSDSREFQIGMTRHSGGGRSGGVRLVLLAVLAVLAFGVGPLAARADAAAAKVAPKVVLIVGPAGGATPGIAASPMKLLPRRRS